jgi:nucleobase:cation symporter-1, NCS1 family
MDDPQAAGPSAEQNVLALAGRLPVLFSARIYTSYGALLLTFAAISAASYSYLVGAALIGVGSTRIGIAGYLIGLVIGIAFVTVAGGAASFRHGVDTVDGGKAALGTRGAIVLLVGVLVCTLGWENVLLAMTARGAGKLLGAEEPVIVGIGIALVVTIWAFVRRGPTWMERVANYCAVAQLAIAVVLLWLLLHRMGVAAAWQTDVPAAQAYATDPLTRLSLAVEFGICNALGMLPYMGGLARLVRRSRHLVGPTVLGYAVFGAFFIAVVGALATAATGQVDPADWIGTVAGSQLGRVLLSIILLANMGALVTQVYLAAVSIQQIRVFAKLPWPVVVALVLVPGIPVAFNSAWVIDHVMNWLAYNGVIFVGLAAVLFVDFMVLRRGRLVAERLFAIRPAQAYWFAGGINWIAVCVVALATWVYFQLFNPSSLRASPAFRYAGASIPTLVGAGVLYYLLMRWLVVTRQAAHYTEPPIEQETVEVGL